MADTVKKKILIADDEKNLVGAIELFLHSHDFETISAADGQECLDKVSAHQPDLILMDIMMPMINGLEACRQLKKNPATRHIPIIILTAGQYINSAEEASQVGAHSYFLKPFSLESLLATIKVILFPEQ